MGKRLHVIYIPGVGDSDPAFQHRAIASWSWWGVNAELFQINWSQDTKWRTKFDLLLTRIDELIAAGHNVALVGASAGGSAAINAYAARKENIVGAVIICGKLKNAEDIGPNYSIANPPLVDSVTASEKALGELTDKNRERILCRYALYDGRIRRRGDSKIKGARNRMSPTFGHAFTIGLQLVFGAPSFLRFLKQQTGKI